MKTYKVIRNCQLNGRRMYLPGQIVELNDDVVPSSALELVTGPVKQEEKPVVKEAPMSLAQAGKMPEVIGGFGSSVDTVGDITSKEPSRRGRPKKK